MSHVGAASAGPLQSGESLVGGRTRKRYGPWEAWCCTLSSVIVRLHVGETGKHNCFSIRPCGLGLHGRFNIITADVTSSGNGSDDEDSSEDMIYPTVFPGWDRSVAKDEYAPSTSKELHFSLNGFFLLFPVLPDILAPLPHIYCVKTGCSSRQLFLQKCLFCDWNNHMRSIWIE